MKRSYFSKCIYLSLIIALFLVMNTTSEAKGPPIKEGGHNLSYPIMFLDGQDKAGSFTSFSPVFTAFDPNYGVLSTYDTIQYYSSDNNDWQASVDYTPVSEETSVTIYWADNLTKAYWGPTSTIRLENFLHCPAPEGMMGYPVESINGVEGVPLKLDEIFGIKQNPDKEVESPYYAYEFDVVGVYTHNATMKVEKKISDTEYTTLKTYDLYGGELNASGKIIYGDRLVLRGLELVSGDTLRLTFSLPADSKIRFADVDERNKKEIDDGVHFEPEVVEDNRLISTLEITLYNKRDIPRGGEE